jgi:hypothetical protein
MLMLDRKSTDAPFILSSVAFRSDGPSAVAREGDEGAHDADAAVALAHEWQVDVIGTSDPAFFSSCCYLSGLVSLGFSCLCAPCQDAILRGMSA